MTPTPTQLACEFCRVLNEWLTPEEFEEIIRLNSEESDPNICHSGDYCDSNQALLDAMAVFGIDGFDQSLIPLCNDTRAIARAAGFNSTNIPGESARIERGSTWSDSQGNRVVVQEASADKVSFYREGGGWIGDLPLEEWFQLNTPAKPVKELTWRASNVELEDTHSYPCWLCGQKWNGLECPSFERETVARVLQNCGH